MEWRFGFAVLLMCASQFTQVCGTAEAQEQGPTQGGASQAVRSDARSARQDLEPAVPQPGKADGKGNPELGRERRPPYRFAKSDILEINFTYTPEFNQSVTVQPDGRIALRGAGQVIAEDRTSAELHFAEAMSTTSSACCACCSAIERCGNGRGASRGSGWPRTTTGIPSLARLKGHTSRFSEALGLTDPVRRDRRAILPCRPA